jgi:hypothetical protein
MCLPHAACTFRLRVDQLIPRANSKFLTPEIFVCQMIEGNWFEFADKLLFAASSKGHDADIQ